MKQEDLIKNYSNISVKKLSEVIRKNGFTYKLLKRDHQKLIYEQYLDKEIIGYEVFRNSLKDNHLAQTRFCRINNKQFNPDEHEKYYESFPGDEEFGKRAFTYKTLDQALLAYETKFN